MRDISYGALCDILKKGLDEDVQLHGTFEAFSTLQTDSLFFSYRMPQ